MRRFAGVVRNTDGGAMVEFAIVGGAFAVLMLGVAEFGFESWARSSVASDAREGARYAIVHGATSTNVATAADIQSYVRSRTSLDASIVVTTVWNPDNKPGSVVTVTVEHTRPRRGPFIPAGTDSSASQMTVLF